MACNWTRWRRRRLFEYDEDWNAPCKAQTGFVLGGSITRYYWFRVTQAQTYPQWQWLDQGWLLTSRTPIAPQNTGDWSNVNLPSIYLIQLRTTGSNYPEFGPGGGSNLQASMQITMPILGATPVQTARRVQFCTGCTVRHEWNFGLGTQFTYTPDRPDEEKIQGSVICTPLERCHTCQDDPFPGS